MLDNIIHVTLCFSLLGYPSADLTVLTHMHVADRSPYYVDSMFFWTLSWRIVAQLLQMYGPYLRNLDWTWRVGQPTTTAQ